MEQFNRDLQEGSHKEIVFFDGVCNFCNSTVDLIWKKNKRENLFFSSLQSDFAQSFLKEKGIKSLDLHSIYFFEKGTIFKKSRAGLRIMTHFNGFYRVMAYILMIIPTFIADPVYSLIAKNRYKLSGQRDQCRIPGPEEKSRFLE